MSTHARAERATLCTLAGQLGPDAPTLCGDWTVRDLVAHLVVREGSPAAIGVAVKPLAGWLEAAMDKRRAEGFGSLVGRLRTGPPAYSLFAMPWLGERLNLLEFYIHHEDVRRAQPGWEPRSLSRETEDVIWRVLTLTGRGLGARSEVGVTVERADTGERAELRKRTPGVVLRGVPSELTLYLFGRKAHALVELDGSPEDVEVLQATSFAV